MQPKQIKKEARSIAKCHFKSYYKAITRQRMCNWHKVRKKENRTNEQNRMLRSF